MVKTRGNYKKIDYSTDVEGSATLRGGDWPTSPLAILQIQSDASSTITNSTKASGAHHRAKPTSNDIPFGRTMTKYSRGQSGVGRSRASKLEGLMYMPVDIFADVSSDVQRHMHISTSSFANSMAATLRSASFFRHWICFTWLERPSD